MEGLELKLVQYGLLTREQLELAKDDALRCHKSVWSSLVKLGYLSEEDIAIFFSHESGVNFVRISDYEIDVSILRLVDENFCRQNTCIPLFKIKDILFVACENPLDALLADNLTKINGNSVELLIATRNSIIHALDLYWGPQDSAFKSADLIYKQRPLQGLVPWRESERLNLNIPVNISIEGSPISLNCSSPLEGYTRNISQSGTAIGLQVFLFLPRGVNVSLEFKPQETKSAILSSIKARGEVVYSRMEKEQHYLLGIIFTEIEDEARSRLFELANHA